jgi:hypothetical protein
VRFIFSWFFCPYEWGKIWQGKKISFSSIAVQKNGVAVHFTAGGLDGIYSPFKRASDGEQFLSE